MANLIGVFAEFERDLIRERVRAGIQNAKVKGIRVGRRSLIDKRLLCTVREMRDRGMKIRSIANQLNISPSLVHKTLKILSQESIENQGSEVTEEVSF